MSATALRYPPKPSPGDRVAVVSPSMGLPAVFPQPYELGLRRLREDFGLEPVEYPTTRVMGATPAERAADLNAAFADPSITAVLATIGGEDLITVLPHLDPEVLRHNPKPVFGYSDTCNLLHYLWGLGAVTYHGGSVMVHLGRPGAMHPTSAESLRRALFDRGPWTLPEPSSYSDQERPWDEPATFEREPESRPASPWSWHGRAERVEGRTWGGCLEIVDFQLRAGRWLRPLEEYDGAVLLLETSEELPPASYVYRVLLGMGERGLLGRFAAVVVGRAKAWSLEQPLAPEAKESYAADQRAAILRALDEYNPDVPTVFDVDLGHTDPQVVIPHGGTMVVDAAERSLTVVY